MSQSLYFKLIFGGAANEPSLLDLQLLGASALGPVGAKFDAWCLNPLIEVNSDSATSNNYLYQNINFYAADETSLIQANMSTLSGLNLNNLDSVSYLLNWYTGTNTGISVSEVQMAIWTLMGVNVSGSAGDGLRSWLTTYNYGAIDTADVANLVGLALAHDGYVPEAGQSLAVVVDPLLDGVHKQPLVIEVKAAQLGDKVWHDLDADGIQDAGEAGIGGVKVTLSHDINGDGIVQANEIIRTTTTDASGNYLFKGLTPGVDYQVSFDKPAGYDVASPANQGGNSALDSNGPVSTPVVLTPGESNLSIDAGFYKYASLGDKVWIDSDKDGIQDPNELGKAGVRVELYNCTTNALIATTTTAADGSYLFDHLAPGIYHVKFIASDGSVLTTADVGSDDGADSDANPMSGITGCYTLNSGDHNTTVDAGFKPLATASYGDRVWEDKNANGIQDAGENGIGGVTVTLTQYTDTGTLTRTTTTDANGNYLFSNLEAGFYAAQVTAPGGYVITAQNQGFNPLLDSDINSSGGTVVTQLVDGESDLSWDAGLYRTASLGDKAWIDGNQNGIQDPGEAGKGGVRVELYNCTTNALVDVQTTAADGSYLFTGLKPGSYHVKFIASDGSVLTSANIGSNDAVDSDADAMTGITGCYTLSSGETNTTVDAGFKPAPTAALGDRLWLDANGNGVQDAGESGIAGATVKLIDASGNVIATTTTGATGLYLFDHLAAGQYAVQFSAPSGYAFTTRDAGGDDAADSDADTSTGRTGYYTLSDGQTNLSVDAGVKSTLLASYGDRVWEDGNANGVQDAGEQGIAGVTVKLYTSANVLVGTTTTDANGNYLFSNLAPGDYKALFTTPTGYVITGQDKGGNDAADSDIASTGYTAVTNLSAGETDISWDAGFYRLASLGDRVWFDTNRNGIQDAGEAGKSGVVLQLWKSGADGLVGTADDVYANQQTTTDANGNYKFSGLVPDSYYVKLTSGVNATTETITAALAGGDTALDSNLNKIDTSGITGCTTAVTLRSGEYNPTVDIGVTSRLGSLGDYVWFDTNRDGYQNDGNTGIAGVKVTLSGAGFDGIFGTADDTTQTTSTDASGKYLFSSLVAGNYQVTFDAGTIGAGNAFTTANYGNNGYDTADSDANVTTGRTDTITLTAGQNRTDVDAGVVDKLGSLGDRVWFDTNRNGIQDAGEAGKSGVLVRLFNVGADGIAGTGDDVSLGDKYTDSNGNYLFTDLKAGSYAIKLYNGYGISSATEQATTAFSAGSTQANDSNLSKLDADGVGGYSNVITLAKGETNLTVDAGIVAKVGSLGDYVWYDNNNDGYQNDGATGVAGVTVKLYTAGVDGVFGTADDVLKATTTTDASGKYLFSNLVPDNYQVGFSGLPAGYQFTTPDYGNNGADTADSDANQLTGRTGTVTLGAGQNRTDVDAGLTKLGSIGDYVWFDTNRDGYQNDGNTGIAGVKVKLLGAGGDGLFGTADDLVLGTTTTDASGKYLFSNLYAGNYKVNFDAGTVGVGNVFTTANYGNGGDAGTGYDVGDSDADVNTGTTAVVALGAGQNRTDVDAGVVDKLGSLGDRVWFDTNRNGIQDAGEAGKSGVLVRLFNVGADGIAGTGDDVSLGDKYTDSNGNYLFTDLKAGSYAIKLYNGYGINSATEQATTAFSAGSTQANDSNLSKLDADGVGGYSNVVTLAKGETNLTVDAGIVAKVGSIGDYVWYDKNNDGYQNDGATGAAGVTVSLYTAGADGLFGTADDVLKGVTTTDSTGKYLFSNLVPDNYQVVFSNLPAAYQFTTANYGNGGDAGTGYDVGDSDANIATGRTATITLAAGQNRTDVDAGLVTAASLGDRVWYDLDRDGQQDNNEPGAAGIAVTLTGAGADGVLGTGDDTFAATLTNASGNYLFSNLTPGMQYQVQFIAPTGTSFTTRDTGADATDSDADLVTGKSQVVTLKPGEQNLTIDAGLLPTMSNGQGINPDVLTVCEDLTGSVNVLANDVGSGLKLIGVTHETAALDALFTQRGGSLSFTSDGTVSYKTMSDYYGFDKLIYTVQNSAGQIFQQSVDVNIRAVSDAPTAGPGANYHPGGWEEAGANYYVHIYTVSDFGSFSDAKDQLQQFGSYNANVANDADTQVSVILQGLDRTGGFIRYNGVALDFSNGQTYEISMADIAAGKLGLQFSSYYVSYKLSYAYKDSGDILNSACYNGSTVSVSTSTTISTPIALDLNGDHQIGVTGATSSFQKDHDAPLGRTVQFDMDGDGRKENIEWFNGSGDGILVDNRDGNAAHDMSGLRLFGDGGGAFVNGYEKLASFDLNGDGRLSGSELQGIQLWVDNGDGVVQDGELQTLAQHAIASISTAAALIADEAGKLHLQADATRSDGSRVLSEDVFFQNAGVDAPAPIKLGDLLGSDASVDGLLGSVAAPDASTAANDAAVHGSHADAGELLRRLTDLHIQAHAAA